MLEGDEKEKTQVVKEGKVFLYISGKRVQKKSGAPFPLSSKGGVFYNPGMIFNRDLSVLIFNHLLSDGMRVLDALSATGVRGLRYGKEIEKEMEIVFNDRNPEAVKLIKKNINLNFSQSPHILTGLSVRNLDLNILLHSEKFECVDLDPFGSPLPFLDSCMKSLRHNSLLAVTATDTSSLCGTYPKTGLRKYGSWVTRNPFTHESGLRNLVGVVVRIGASYNKAMIPLLSHAHHYYYRVYFRVKSSRRMASEMLKNMGYLIFSPADLSFETVHYPEIFEKREKVFLPREQEKFLGPIWLGPTFDKSLLLSLLKELENFSYLQYFSLLKKMLELWKEESTLTPFFYRTDLFSSKFRISQPKISTLIQYLKERGFKASRTHFSPYGVKTDAEYEVVEEFFKSWHPNLFSSQRKPLA